MRGRTAQGEPSADRSPAESRLLDSGMGARPSVARRTPDWLTATRYFGRPSWSAASRPWRACRRSSSRTDFDLALLRHDPTLQPSSSAQADDPVLRSGSIGHWRRPFSPAVITGLPAFAGN